MAGLRGYIDSVLDRGLPHLASAQLSDERRMELCRQHGDFSLAYSTAVQKNLSHFGDDKGYIAYATKMGHMFALGDPVADKADRARYVSDFVAAAERPCFVQIGRQTAETLSRLGYRINQMGVDTRLVLNEHSFAGKKNETVRYSERWLLKNGYRIVECDGSLARPDQIKAVSEEWRAGRIVRRREMCFLNRPFKAELSAHMRRFLILDPQGETIDVLDFDPIFDAGQVTGYTSTFKRKKTGTTPHAEIGLTKFATDRFREEGRSLVTLGLSPLAAITTSGFAESAFWRGRFEYAYKSPAINKRIFNLQGQAAFKRRFHGAEEPTYIAFKRRSPLEMLALLRLLKTL